MQGGKPRGDIFILASIAAPDMAYGLMAGYKHRNWGGYLAFRSSFTSCKTSYSCASDGSMENGSKIWPTGNEKRSNLMVGGGVLAGATKWLTIYAGAGYGARKLAWEDVAGNWALVSDWSHAGMAVECGAVVSVRKLALSAGISTVAFRTAAFTCGLGVRF
jgi:opacity protein-like surface antigen